MLYIEFHTDRSKPSTDFCKNRYYYYICLLPNFCGWNGCRDLGFLFHYRQFQVDILSRWVRGLRVRKLTRARLTDPHSSLRLYFHTRVIFSCCSRVEILKKLNATLATRRAAWLSSCLAKIKRSLAGHSSPTGGLMAPCAACVLHLHELPLNPHPGSL